MQDKLQNGYNEQDIHVMLKIRGILTYQKIPNLAVHDTGQIVRPWFIGLHLQEIVH